jgi:hypothetical protein
MTRRPTDGWMKGLMKRNSRVKRGRWAVNGWSDKKSEYISDIKKLIHKKSASIIL